MQEMSKEAHTISTGNTSHFILVSYRIYKILLFDGRSLRQAVLFVNGRMAADYQLKGCMYIKISGCFLSGRSILLTPPTSLLRALVLRRDDFWLKSISRPMDAKAAAEKTTNDAKGILEVK
jgi:hypothetical protein